MPDPTTTQRQAFPGRTPTEGSVATGTGLAVEGGRGAWRHLTAFVAYLRYLTGPRSGQVTIAKVSLGVARLHEAGPITYVSRQLVNALGVSPDEIRRVEEGVLAARDLPDAAAVAYSRSLVRRRFAAVPELRDPLLRYFSQGEIERLEQAAEAISASCRTGWSMPALRDRFAGDRLSGRRFSAELAAAAVHLLGLGPLVVRVSWLRRRSPLSLLREYRSARGAVSRVIDLRLPSGESG